MSAPQEFREFAAGHGFELPANIEPGKFIRFQTNGKRGDTAGWARLFEDCEGGIVGDWRAGTEVIVWQAKQARQLTPQERIARQVKIDNHKREAKALREREENEAAARARLIWEAAPLAFVDHPYLKAKRIPGAGLKLYKGPELVISGVDVRGALLMPFRNAQNELRTLEFIAPDGQKRFLPGGSYAGCYLALGRAGEKPGDVLCICEGAATAISIQNRTHLPVRAAGTAGNLLAVAQAMRSKLPDAKLVLCADNDAETDGNPGIKYATEAARAVGGFLAVPPSIDDKATDFNDLASTKDPTAAVRAAISEAKAVDQTEVAKAVAGISTPVQKPNSGDPGEGESWSEPQELPDQLPAVLPFAFDLLPSALRGWIEDITERVQCPPEFVAVPAIVALGSLIGRKVAVRPKEKDDWEEFPNLWGAIIGRPGVLKSPALNQVLKPLRRLEAKAAEENQSEVASWQAGKEAAKVRRSAAFQKAKSAASKGLSFDADGLVLNDDEQAPMPRRYIVNDSSVEALGEVLMSSPNGVLAFRDELSGLLRSLDREGMEGSRAFYLSAYSGKEAHVFDRIGRGLNLRVDHCCISMLGSIQPDVIASYLREAISGGGGDGLLSRFSLLVWPDTSGEWKNVDRWPDTAHRQAANDLYDRMDSLDPQTIGAELQEGEAPFLRLDDAARGCFLEWREGYELKQRTTDEHPALVAHFAKYRKLVPSLALIFHLADKGIGPIPETAILRALGWAELLETHARRAYASVQQARVESARALLAKIKAGLVPNPIRLRDVYLKHWSGLSEPEEARRAADLLDEMDYLRRATMETGGRSATVYWINPRVKP